MADKKKKTFLKEIIISAVIVCVFIVFVFQLKRVLYLQNIQSTYEVEEENILMQNIQRLKNSLKTYESENSESEKDVPTTYDKADFQQITKPNNEEVQYDYNKFSNDDDVPN
jgi:hypothetical protein